MRGHFGWWCRRDVRARLRQAHRHQHLLRRVHRYARDAQSADAFGFLTQIAEPRAASRARDEVRLQLSCAIRWQLPVQVAAERQEAAPHSAISRKIEPNSRRAAASNRAVESGEHSSTRDISR